MPSNRSSANFGLSTEIIILKFTFKNIKAVYKSLFLCFFINISFSQILINDKLESRIKNITNAKNFKGVISSENVLNISNEFGLDNDQIMELFRPYSKMYSKAPISNYNVGAICKGGSGNLYFGSNIEILNDEPRIGAEGFKIVFIHPKATGGVLVELAEKPS